MFVSLLTYAREIPHEDPRYQAHAAFIREHAERSEILCAGPRIGVRGGCILVYGDDEAAARELLDTDPFVTDGVATYELHQFRVGLADPRSSLAA